MTKGTSRASKPRKSAAKAKSGASGAKATGTPSRLIDQRIRDLGDWREETLALMRALILEADPEMIEERKWRKPSNAMAGVPVWSHHGIVCTGETYTKVVKLTFARGASIPGPSRLFNSSLEGNTRRAIDIHEGGTVDARAFKTLVKAAVAQNGPPAKKARPGAGETKPMKLLSGGNPQIAKADGDAPVQAYIAAMPGWKRDIGRRLDALIVRHVPSVRKAVKWNSPFYGIEGHGWFLSFHVFAPYVKVTFFRGTLLRPVPAGSRRVVHACRSRAIPYSLIVCR
ncbi:MAG: DUF1801 domain-containing protein [Vicinamibacterales bacterium]